MNMKNKIKTDAKGGEGIEKEAEKVNKEHGGKAGKDGQKKRTGRKNGKKTKVFPFHCSACTAQ